MFESQMLINNINHKQTKKKEKKKSENSKHTRDFFLC